MERLNDMTILKKISPPWITIILCTLIVSILTASLSISVAAFTKATAIEMQTQAYQQGAIERTLNLKSNFEKHCLSAEKRTANIDERLRNIDINVTRIAFKLDVKTVGN